MPRVAHPVVDPLALHGPEEREVVGGDVDRSSPRALDARLGERRQQTPQAVLRPRRSWVVRREALVDAAAKSDRTGAAAHEHAPVRRRAEVVEEHACVEDRFPARPADLLQQLGNGLCQNDVRAEVRHMARDGPPAGRGSVDRHDDLGRANVAARRRDVSGVDPERRRLLVQLDTGVHHGAAKRLHEACRLHGRALPEVDAAAEDRGPDSLGNTVCVERHRLLARIHFCGSGDGALDGIVLRRRSRNHQDSGLT